MALQQSLTLYCAILMFTGGDEETISTKHEINYGFEEVLNQSKMDFKTPNQQWRCIQSDFFLFLVDESLFDWTIDPKKRITHIIDTLKIADYQAFPFGLATKMARVEFWAKDMVLLGSYLVLSGLCC